MKALEIFQRIQFCSKVSVESFPWSGTPQKTGLLLLYLLCPSFAFLRLSPSIPLPPSSASSLLSAPSVSPLSLNLLSPHLYMLPCLEVLEVLPERDGEQPVVAPELCADVGREQGRRGGGRGGEKPQPNWAWLWHFLWSFKSPLSVSGNHQLLAFWP